ncbi:uncharacterized protein [Aegilops tauschii subsp. strangulata]|uniref:uncharacterized protein n=1 Tax=Aegilops tauschii subsp. strangulata TaxID=200361 RepID=UPI00098AD1A0|nr:uncharacterized protein LOC109783011 [Aegilops tauschii subsp. strangulata]
MDAQLLRQRLTDGDLEEPWRLDDGLLLHERRLFVPDHGDLRHQALLLAHSAGHEGVQKTLHRLRADFYILGYRALVWADISIDFIEGLPKVGSKSVILTVVDRFSKYAHFIALGHPYTATSIARAFFDGIVRLHGLPSSIVSDRDPVFTGHPKTARTEAAVELLCGRDEILAEVRQRLLQAHQLSKKYYNAHYREAKFVVGDWVWLRLLHHTTQSLDPRTKRKLGPRYARPFSVLERIDNVAYRLQLPSSARIHNVFHVGLLKPFHGEPPATTPDLPPTSEGRLLPGPAKVLKAQQSRGVWRLLIQWQGLLEEDATWEHLDKFRKHFPDFQLEDEVFARAGRDVMTGIHYIRRRPNGAGS